MNQIAQSVVSPLAAPAGAVDKTLPADFLVRGSSYREQLQRETTLGRLQEGIDYLCRPQGWGIEQLEAELGFKRGKDPGSYGRCSFLPETVHFVDLDQRYFSFTDCVAEPTVTFSLGLKRTRDDVQCGTARPYYIPWWWPLREEEFRYFDCTSSCTYFLTFGDALSITLHNPQSFRIDGGYDDVYCELGGIGPSAEEGGYIWRRAAETILGQSADDEAQFFELLRVAASGPSDEKTGMNRARQFLNYHLNQLPWVYPDRFLLFGFLMKRLLDFVQPASVELPKTDEHWMRRIHHAAKSVLPEGFPVVAV